MFGPIAAALPWLIPLIIGAVVASAVTFLPQFLRPWARQLDPAQRAALAAITKGAYTVLAAIAMRTPTTLDNDLAKLLLLVSDELGRPLTLAEAEQVRRVGVAMHADPRRPTLSPPKSGDIAGSLAVPIRDLLSHLPTEQQNGVVRGLKLIQGGAQR